MSTVTKYTNAAAAGDDLHARAEKYAETHNCSYREGVIATLAADKQLAEAYAQPAVRVATMARKPAVPLPAPAPLAQGKTPGEEVHRRTAAIREMDAGLSYQMAVNLVLAADPALKTAYARS